MNDYRFYNKIYKEIGKLIGEDAAKKIWEKYGGLTVNFPKNLYSNEYAREYIRKNSGKIHPGKMARSLNLTERRVRQIIKELKDEKNEDTDSVIEEKSESR